MSTAEPVAPAARPLPVARRLAARDVLYAAWPLFQVSLPGCLPLAVLGVAAGATPGAEAVAAGEGRGFLHSGEWWGLYAASTVLMLICYAGILRQQLARAAGARLGVLDSLRRSLAGFLSTLGVVLPCVAVLLPGLALMYAAGWIAGLPALLAGILALMYLAFGGLAQLDEGLGASAALRRSVQLVRGRVVAVAGIFGTLLAAVLVFVLLAGILMAVVMNLAGGGAQQTHAGLAFSRWLMAGLLSLPVVYVSAVSVSAWRALLATSRRA
ncbi:MAG: hypothetical protein QM696_07130 [Steroidobacteraceae bacterium]